MAKKILIAEDEIEILQLFTNMLKTAGYETMAAADGEQALQLLEDNSPDLVLLDLKMPKKDGFEVLETLQEQNRIDGTKVVVFSNIANEDWKKKAKELGAYDYWLKVDTHLTEFIDKVKGLLGD